MEENFEVRLVEEIKYYRPADGYRQNAWTGDYERAFAEYLADPVGFWEREAHSLEWSRPWDTVLEWDYPYARWFAGARLNITRNCLDRHLVDHRRNKVALIWRGETGEERIYTYYKLWREVNRFANGLRSLGVGKGDRVCIYMPVVPEQVIAMLACARIGAVHSVVFGGFGAQALATRLNDASARVVITADIGYRRGKRIPLITIVEEAVIDAPSVERIVLLRRQRDHPVDIHPERETDFHALMDGQPFESDPEEMDAEDPFFILYTSGSTGRPKGVVHTCGGYMVGVHYTTRHIFDFKDSDVFWCTADPGWITGHSYVVYGPLMVGGTVVLFEGTPDYPDAGAFWKVIEDLGVTIFYTAPTAIRMFMKVGEEWPARFDLRSLRVLGSVGEPFNPEAFEWYHRVIGGGRCPIVDTWWQTETGMAMVTTMIGEPMRPGFAGRPIPGVTADVVNRQGEPVPPGTGGFLVIREPWPAMFRTVYGDDARYRQYWETVPGCYLAGDLAVKGSDGYIMVIGRADDLIIVSGHNIGTAEVESALVSHGAVAEAAVIGKPDPLKGNRIKAFVILKLGEEPSERLRNDLVYQVRMTLGPFAVPSEIEFVDALPKTETGKIQRFKLRQQEEQRAQALVKES